MAPQHAWPKRCSVFAARCLPHAACHMPHAACQWFALALAFFRCRRLCFQCSFVAARVKFVAEPVERQPHRGSWWCHTTQLPHLRNELYSACPLNFELRFTVPKRDHYPNAIYARQPRPTPHAQPNCNKRQLATGNWPLATDCCIVSGGCLLCATVAGSSLRQQQQRQSIIAIIIIKIERCSITTTTTATTTTTCNSKKNNANENNLQQVLHASVTARPSTSSHVELEFDCSISRQS